MTSNTGPGPRILRSLQSAAGKGIVHIEDRFETDIDDLWSALTGRSRLLTADLARRGLIVADAPGLRR